MLLRAANPDLWHPYRGGEKPFELSMFTAVLRTRTLPPYDPWFSGGTLNYHYGGYLLLSVPDTARKLHSDWWRARIARQKEIDASIAARAEFETLYDKPYQNTKCVRVAGPFTVESLSPHRMLGVDEDDELIDGFQEDRAGYSARHGQRHQRARPVGGGIDGRDPGPHQRTSRDFRQGDRAVSPAAAAGDREGRRWQQTVHVPRPCPAHSRLP